jgi:hypothetical protein
MSTNKEGQQMALAIYSEAAKYLNTLKKSLTRPSKFNRELRYGICVMCFEKLLVAHIMHFGVMAEHHVPLALYNEATKLDPDFPVRFKATAQLIGKFESICSLEGFGYRKADEKDIHDMISGMVEIDEYIRGDYKL